MMRKKILAANPGAFLQKKKKKKSHFFFLEWEVMLPTLMARAFTSPVLVRKTESSASTFLCDYFRTKQRGATQ